ncbi:hypothetical protein DFH29DRAFT_905968 [Suillus ampliporus]|nr:hypothetical protein DFH29DRAFT_905968 [Suillus ampliporus]
MSPGLQPLGSSSDQKSRLFDIFRPHYHTVLTFANNSIQAAPIRTELEKSIVHTLLLLPEGSYNSNHRGVVIDTRGHACDAYQVKSGQLKVILIVRPDGVVGAIV